jgi:hypothetical protein
MSGFKTFSPGDVIRANDVQGFLMDQAVMVFPSDAVRATAIVVPTEGMLSWVEDDNKYQYYDGASWEDLIVPIVGGTQGQAYISGGTASAAFGDMNSRFIATTVTEKSASYTIQSIDVGSIIQTTGTANVTITIPDVFSVGDSVQIIRDGAGSAIIAAGTGVTSWAGIGTANTGATFYIDTQFAAAAVVKTDSAEYRVIGRISR